MAHYSNGLPYLEDIGVEETRDVECSNCVLEDVAEGTHYRDSETFIWECVRCGYRNEIDAPVDTSPDPDYIHDNQSIPL